MNSPEAVNRLVVFGDACGSGRMNMAAKKQMREGMYAAFDEAFDSVGVRSEERHQEDRGDGILVALDPAVPSSLMVGRWLVTLYESLRAHNTVAATRLRMRVAMHMGPVLDDGRGLVGRAVDLTCRLCDSEAAKEAVARAEDSDLLHVVSDWLYENVVREGGRHIEPGHYRRVRVGNKETDELAWFRVPGLSQPPVCPGAGDAAPPGRWTEGGAPAASGLPDEAADEAVNEAPDEVADGPDEAPGARRSGGRTTTPWAVRNEFHVQGDSLTVEGNVIHGGFTGIRKDGGARDGGTGGGK